MVAPGLPPLESTWRGQRHRITFCSRKTAEYGVQASTCARVACRAERRGLNGDEAAEGSRLGRRLNTSSGASTTPRRVALRGAGNIECQHVFPAPSRLVEPKDPRGDRGKNATNSTRMAIIPQTALAVDLATASRVPSKSHFSIGAVQSQCAAYMCGSQNVAEGSAQNQRLLLRRY